MLFTSLAELLEFDRDIDRVSAGIRLGRGIRLIPNDGGTPPPAGPQPSGVSAVNWRGILPGYPLGIVARRRPGGPNVGAYYRDRWLRWEQLNRWRVAGGRTLADDPRLARVAGYHFLLGLAQVDELGASTGPTRLHIDSPAELRSLVGVMQHALALMYRYGRPWRLTRCGEPVTVRRLLRRAAAAYDPAATPESVLRWMRFRALLKFVEPAAEEAEAHRRMLQSLMHTHAAVVWRTSRIVARRYGLTELPEQPGEDITPANLAQALDRLAAWCDRNNKVDAPADEQTVADPDVAATLARVTAGKKPRDATWTSADPQPNGAITDDRVWIDGRPYRLTADLRQLVHLIFANPDMHSEQLIRLAGCSSAPHLQSRLTALRRRLQTEMAGAPAVLNVWTEDGRIRWSLGPLDKSNRILTIK